MQFSSASVSINLPLDECKAFKCEATSSLDVTPVKAGSLLSVTDRKLGS